MLAQVLISSSSGEAFHFDGGLHVPKLWAQAAARVPIREIT